MTMRAPSYVTRSSRLSRTLLTIVFLYALLNGSPFNILNGIRWVATIVIANADVFWSVVGLVILLAVLGGLGVFMARRWKLAKNNTSIPLLATMTAVVAALLGVAIAIFMRIWTGSAYMTGHQIWSVFTWTWQIPLGFFVGTGLSWAVVDRQIAGIFTTQQPIETHHNASLPVDITIGQDQHHPAA